MKVEEILLEKIKNNCDKNTIIVNDISDYWECIFNYLCEKYNIEFDSETGSYTSSDNYNLKNEIAGIIKKAVEILLFEGRRKKDIEAVVNRVMSSSIDMLICEILNDSDFGLTLVENYVNYLVKVRYFSIISIGDLISLEIKFPWLKGIVDSKGFISLNSIARDILESLSDLAADCQLNIEEACALYDKYFKSATFDRYILERAECKDYSKKDILWLKSYQIRLLYADIYAYLEIENLGEEEFYNDDLYSFVKETIDFEDYRLPKDRDFRRRLYDCYFSSEYRYMPSEFKNILGSNDKIMCLKEANPLYFLD